MAIDGITGVVLLWLSYQRYALLGGLTIALTTLAAVALDHAWWAWLIAAGVAAGLGPLSALVWREWPRKRKATELASRRIESGTFSPQSLQAYCGDPCWRVVAHEILQRQGMPRAQRRRLVAQLRAKQQAESSALLIIDHQNGTLIRVEDGVTVTTPLPPQAT